MSKFKITDVILLTSVNNILLIGDIIEGKIKVGMKFYFGDKQFTIQKVESVAGEINTINVSKIALEINSQDKFRFENELIKSPSNSIEIELT